LCEPSSELYFFQCPCLQGLPFKWCTNCRALLLESAPNCCDLNWPELNRADADCSVVVTGRQGIDSQLSSSMDSMDFVVPGVWSVCLRRVPSTVGLANRSSQTNNTATWRFVWFLHRFAFNWILLLTLVWCVCVDLTSPHLIALKRESRRKTCWAHCQGTIGKITRQSAR